MHFHTYVILRRCRFSCTSTHTSCYAAVGSLALPDAAVGSLGLPHIHRSCYAAVGSFYKEEEDDDGGDVKNDDDGGDDDDDDDDDDIDVDDAYETKVSFLRVRFPHTKMFEK